MFLHNIGYLFPCSCFYAETYSSRWLLRMRDKLLFPSRGAGATAPRCHIYFQVTVKIYSEDVLVPVWGPSMSKIPNVEMINLTEPQTFRHEMGGILGSYKG